MLSQIVEHLINKIPECEAVLNEAEVGDSSICVSSGSIVKVCEELRDGPHKFHTLQLITGVDYPEEIEVNYILGNFYDGHELILKAKVQKLEDKKNLPSIDSVVSVWGAANFQERECYDLMGVNFSGHPDLRRILLSDDWVGHPLQKDYVAEKEFHGMVIYPENKSNSADRAFSDELKASEKKKLAEAKAKKAAAEALAEKVDKPASEE